MDTDVKSYTEKQLEDKSSKNMVDELSTVHMCREILCMHSIFAGGSN